MSSLKDMVIRLLPLLLVWPSSAEVKEHKIKTQHRRSCTLSLVVAMLLLGTSVVAWATGNFATVTLPKGVSIQLPKNWVVLSNNQRITLDTFVESGLDLSGGQQQLSELPFAANYYDDRGNTIGILNVRYYPQLDLSQADARSATNQDVMELDTALKENMTKEMKAFGMSITSWNGTSKTEINRIAAFITEYRRASTKGSGDFQVRLVRVLAGDRSFTLTVSYLEPASIILKPIADRIISSLRLSGISDQKKITTSAPTSKRSDSSSVVPYLYGEQWGLVLVFSLIITWGIGLAPPLLIRFVFIRHPIGKGWAIGVVALFSLINLVLFSALRSQSKTHGALALVAFVSYAILRKGAKKHATPAQGR